MKDLAIAMIVAVSGVLLMTITGGHGLCVGSQIPELGDSSVCTNSTDVPTLLCRVRCILCHLGKVEVPYGCLTNGKEGKSVCHCIGGNSTAPRGMEPMAVTPTNPPIGRGGPSSTDLPSLPEVPDDGVPPLLR